MNQSEFRELLRRYLAGTCSADEQQLIESWYENLGRHQLVAPLSETERDELRARIWNRLERRVLPTTSTPAAAPVLTASTNPAVLAAAPEAAPLAPSASWWQQPVLRWAAALVLLAAGLGLWRFGPRPAAGPAPLATTVSVDVQGWITHQNRTSQVLAVRLEDGSTAALHPASSLRFPTHFAADHRDVQLTGEAFFEVSKNPQRPFRVYTREVVTTVLGTSFRVRAYPYDKQVTVAVRTGKVAVAPRSPPAANRLLTTGRKMPALTGLRAAAANGVLLLPNQQAVYSAASAQLRTELVDKPAVLVPRQFVFEERPVAEVLAALEQAYGVRIDYDRAALRQCTVNISFGDEPLFEKLGILCKTLGAHYELDHTRILFRSKGCGAGAGGS